MKKIALLLLCFCVGFCAVCGCTPRDDDTVYVYLPDGATAVSLSYMMTHGTEIAGKKIEYIVVKPTLVADYVMGGDADMAVMPTSSAIEQYKTVGYKYAAALTHGNLFLVGTQETALQDLGGKVVGCMGQGQTPDLVFQFILRENGMTPEQGDKAKTGRVVIRYYANGATLRQAIREGQVSYGVLPEPDFTDALGISGVMQLADLQEEWGKITGGYAGYPQSGLVVKSTLDKSFIEAFLQKCAEGDDWGDGKSWAEKNPEAALAAIQGHVPSGSVSTVLSLEPGQIKRCNAKTVIVGLKDYVEQYLIAIGTSQSALPGGGFYFA